MANAAASHSGDHNTPAIASGVTTKVTQGIATALASSPTNDTWLKSNSDNGVSASVITHCSLAADARLKAIFAAQDSQTAVLGHFSGSFSALAHILIALAAPELGAFTLGAVEANSTPTATNDNQNPACINAHGSSATTTAIASSHTSGQGHCLPLCLSKTTVASIQMVRCAGTPQPENSAYMVASTKPPQAPALTAGTARQSAGVNRAERRQSQPITNDRPQANIVMCRPEMLIKCATPVALKTSQSARSIEF